MAQTLCQLKKKGSFGELQIPKGSYIIVYGDSVSDISSYTSGIAITHSSNTLAGILIINPNGNCTINATSSASHHIGMKGYSKGTTVKTVADSVTTSKTETFNNCDMIVVFNIGAGSSVSFTITDN